MKKSVRQYCFRLVKKHLDTHPRRDYFIHYSFIIYQGRVVAWGTNTGGTPKPLYGYKSYGKVHAEQTAYNRFSSVRPKARDFVVLNVRVGKNGEYKMSRPCPSCIALLRHAGCTKVHYTVNSSEMGFIKL